MWERFHPLHILLITLTILVAYYYQIISNIIWETTPAQPKTEALQAELRLFTQQELSRFNGEEGRPIYLALLGNVYDVSKGEKHYGN